MPILTASGMEEACLGPCQLDHSVYESLRLPMSMAPLPPRTHLVVATLSLAGIMCVVLALWIQPGGPAAAAAAAAAPLFADVDSGACGALALQNTDPLVLSLQSRLKTDLTTYCCNSAASKPEEGGSTVSFKLAEPTEGSSSPSLSSLRHQGPAETAVFSALSEMYGTSHTDGGVGGADGGSGSGMAARIRGTAGLGRRRPLPKTLPPTMTAPLGRLPPAALWMLDVGTSTGLFTMHAAASGLNVLAFDPQPACLALRHESLTASALQSRVRLLNVGLGNSLKDNSTIIPPLMHPDRCHGEYDYSWPEAEMRTEGPRVGVVHVPVVPLSNFLEGRHVRAMRMSVKGNEVHVLESALDLIPTK